MRRSKRLVRLGAFTLAALLIVTSAGAVGAGTTGAPVQASAFCRTLAANLTLRSGPGTAFSAVGSLLQGTTFRGVSLVRSGVPGGSWVEIELTTGISSGYLPADTQAVACSPAVTTLPLATAPPAPSGTRDVVSRVPVDGGDLSNNPVVRGPANVNSGQYIILPGVDQNQVRVNIIANDGVTRFSDAIGFGVEPVDRRTGQAIGSGISEVQFDVTYFDDFDGEQKTAYETIEYNVPYCLFSDENGQCNVFRFSKMGYKWPDTAFAKGLPLALTDVQYTAIVTIRTKRNEEIVWRWNFNMAPPGLEFPG